MTEPRRLAYGRKEAAAMCGVSVDLIDKAVASGARRAKRTAVDKYGRPAGLYLIRVADLEAWLDGLIDAL